MEHVIGVIPNNRLIRSRTFSVPLHLGETRADAMRELVTIIDNEILFDEILTMHPLFADRDAVLVMQVVYHTYL